MQKADTIVALVILLLGIVILVDTSILGSGWGMSGPEPGFFPFYMGLGVVICSLFVLRKAFKAYRKEAPGTGKRLIAKGGLAPILWGAGTGADVMKRIAAPMVGGMVTATLLTLAVIPAIYYLWRSWQVERGGLEKDVSAGRGV